MIFFKFVIKKKYDGIEKTIKRKREAAISQIDQYNEAKTLIL